jgi:rhodanese-related sulfurtransferase
MEAKEMNEITAKELEVKFNNDEYISIIDVREDEEVAEGIIPGAYHIPLGQLAERLPEIEQEQHHYFICHSGVRSGQACEVLEQFGYQVTNVAGGMLEWHGKVEI